MIWLALCLGTGTDDARARVLGYRQLAQAGDAQAVETLAAAIPHEQDPAARAAAQDALARIELDRHELATLLAEGDELTRAWAAHQLGHYGGSEAAEALLAAASDPSESVRREVYTALGASDDPRVLKVLRKAAVSDPSARNRDLAESAAMNSLAVRDGADVPLELARLAQGTPDAKVQAATALGKAQDWRAVDPLIDAARTGDAELRKASLLALGHLGDQRAVPSICEVALDQGGQVRYAALAALAYLKDESATPTLEELARDTDSSTRQLAVRALAWTDAPGTAARIRPLLSDASEHVRAEVVLSLGEISDPLRHEGLVDALRDSSPFVRAEAVRLLGVSGEGQEQLVAMLEDRDALVRIAAAGACADRGLTDAVPALTQLASRTRDEDEKKLYQDALERLTP